MEKELEKYYSDLDKELDDYYPLALKHDKIIDEFLEKLDIFVKSGNRNEWIIIDELKVYVRRSMKYFNHKSLESLDLASIDITTPGTGLFTKLIERVLPKYDTIFIESIFDKRFYNFLLKIGFLPYKESERDNLIKVI